MAGHEPDGERPARTAVRGFAERQRVPFPERESGRAAPGGRGEPGQSGQRLRVGPHRDPVARRRLGHRPDVVPVMVGHQDPAEPRPVLEESVHQAEERLPLAGVLGRRIDEVPLPAADEDRVRVGGRRERRSPAGEDPDPRRVPDRHRPGDLSVPPAELGRVVGPALQQADRGRRQRQDAAPPAVESVLGPQPDRVHDLPRSDGDGLPLGKRGPVEARVEAVRPGRRGGERRRRGEVPGDDLPAAFPQEVGERFLVPQNAVPEPLGLLRNERPRRPEQADAGLLEHLPHPGGEAARLFRGGSAPHRGRPVRRFHRAAGEGPEAGKRPQLRRPPHEEHLGAPRTAGPLPRAARLPGQDDGDGGANGSGQDAGD